MVPGLGQLPFLSRQPLATHGATYMDFFLPGARRPLLIPGQHWDTGISPSSSLASMGLALERASYG